LHRCVPVMFPLFDFVTARTVVSARLGFLVYFFSTVRFWSLAALLLIFSLYLSWEHAAQIRSGSLVGYSVKEVLSPDCA
jgi:hypothetical protein